MRTTIIFCLFLLFTFPAEAQSHKTNLIKAVATINGMLHPNRMARFTNQDYHTFYPTKIEANLQGDVSCVASLSAYSTAPNGIMFNLLTVKSFVVKADEIVAFGHKEESILAISYGSEQEMQELKKEFDSLLFICTAYSKLDPKFKCD